MDSCISAMDTQVQGDGGVEDENAAGLSTLRRVKPARTGEACCSQGHGGPFRLTDIRAPSGLSIPEATAGSAAMSRGIWEQAVEASSNLNLDSSRDYYFFLTKTTSNRCPMAAWK